MRRVLLFVCACAVILFAEGFPNNSRMKRETTSEPAKTSTDSEAVAPAEPATTSTTSSPQVDNEFGIGAAAGIGGLNRAVGLGNFNKDVKASDALTPWGAFAGINLGNGGRIGAGCQGLSCGVQFGHLVLATPQLLGLGRNVLNQQNGGGPEGKKGTELTETSETNVNNGAIGGSNGPQVGQNHEHIRVIFRDAFKGFRDTLQSFFRAPVTHFIKKHVHIDNSTESVVGAVKPAASEQTTYRIQLTPARPAPSEEGDAKKNPQENELD